jgi:hypothetical protein
VNGVSYAQRSENGNNAESVIGSKGSGTWNRGAHIPVRSHEIVAQSSCRNPKAKGRLLPPKNRLINRVIFTAPVRDKIKAERRMEHRH